MSVYPNPAVSQATLSYKSENGGLATIRIFNITGVTMASQQVKIVAGENALALNGLLIYILACIQYRYSCTMRRVKPV